MHISVVLMLYNTVRDIIRALKPSGNSQLVREKDQVEEEAAKAKEGAQKARET